MLRFVLLIIISLAAVQAATAQVVLSGDGGDLDRCPTLARMAADGRINQLSNPIFEDREAARKFARDCAEVVREIDSVGALPSNYAGLRDHAAFVAEFMAGDMYLLATSDVKSVVKLREWVKIPPPEGFVYVKKYASRESMPQFVADVFDKLTTSQESQVRGVCIRGRYIALLETEYHDELVDNLAHELVHAYLTLASGVDLPTWFQEGAAVYFSIGKESRLYGKTGDPRMRQVTIPEDYKRKLYSFEYIEQKVGRKKLFEFVRTSVETGQVDPRAALGLGPMQESSRRPIWQAVAVIGVVAVVFLALWLRSSRRDNWID